MIVSAFDYYENQPTKDQLEPWWGSLVPTVRYKHPKDTMISINCFK